MIQAIPLSNDTIHRHISEMSQDICLKLLNKSNLAQQKYLCNLTKPVM